jgi:aminopeptidase C
LAERWTAMIDRADRELKIGDPERSCLTLSCSEQNLDQVCDALARSAARRHALTEPSEDLRKARRNVYQMVCNHDEVVGRLKDAQQKWLWRARNSWQHKLLRSLRADMFHLPPLLMLSWDSDKYPMSLAQGRRNVRF